MHPSLCFLCLPGRALCLNRLFKNAKWTPSAAARAGDGPIGGCVDLFLRDHAGFLTALVDHGHQMRVLQCLWAKPAVEGNEVYPAGIIKDSVHMELDGLFFSPYQENRLCSCVLTPIG